ncbi:MAG: TatD family hydrolase [Solirubrobacterales bacterium]
MIDSHTHLFLCDGGEDELVAAAAEARVSRMLTVGMTAQTNAAAVASAARHEGVFAAVGRHPNEASGFDDGVAEEIRRLAAHEKVRAIGETGLDFYRDYAAPDEQRRAFSAQVQIAGELGLPIVIHARDPEGQTSAIDEIFDALDAHAGAAPVILHCFSAPQRVGDAAERGWYCSFAGNATYPSAKELLFAAAKVPEDRILVETDAPYLSPQPLRGKRNQPAHVVETAREVAAVRGVSYEELERAVEANARALFGW